MVVSENVPLKPYNTFGIDVYARYFTRFRSLSELQELLEHKTIIAQNKLVLGGGSNILFTKDYSGALIKNEMSGIEKVHEEDNYIFVKCQGGENWHQFVLHCIENNWAGVENLSLIPGCSGAAPIQNIGAYGVELKNVLFSLEAFHINDKLLKVFTADECNFGYRESIFKNSENGKWVIISITLRLNKRPVFQTSYGAIEVELERMNLDHLTIKAVSDAVIKIRSSKLPDPKVLGNAGSFFKNPIVARSHFETLKNEFPELASYPVDESRVKLAAGWLIEMAGWKGKRVGNCGVNLKQSLVLVNYGTAKGSEVFELSEMIIEDVRKMFGVVLEREVNIF